MQLEYIIIAVGAAVVLFIISIGFDRMMRGQHFFLSSPNEPDPKTWLEDFAAHLSLTTDAFSDEDSSSNEDSSSDSDGGCD